MRKRDHRDSERPVFALGRDPARRAIDHAGAFLTHCGSIIVVVVLLVFGVQSLLHGVAG